MHYNIRNTHTHTHCYKVTDVVHVTEGGFGRLEAVVEGLDKYRGHRVKVLAKNENYIVRYVEKGYDGGAVLACTPDLICVVDSDTGIYCRSNYDTSVHNLKTVSVLNIHTHAHLCTKLSSN